MEKMESKNLAAEWIPLGVLQPWAKNPRKYEHKIGEAVASLRRFGFCAPVVAWPTRKMIVAGHARLAAMRRILAEDPMLDGAGGKNQELADANRTLRESLSGPSIDHVPVRFRAFRTMQEAEAYALRDNNGIGDWDKEILGAALADIKAQGGEIDGLGWDESDLAELLASHGVGSGEIVEDDPPVGAADELKKKWGTETGQLWRIPSATCPGKEHRLLCGDSRDHAAMGRLMGGGVAAWMWTDPPYGVSYVGKTKDGLTIENDGAGGLAELLSAVYAAVDSVLQDGASVYTAHPAGALCLEFGKAFVEVGWHFHETLIWVKDSMVLGQSDYHFKHEPIIYGWKGKNRTWLGGRGKTSVLEFPKPSRSELHPTMKPVALVAACIENSALPCSVGVEPFSGSGTTLMAAEQTGRLVRAMELDPKFVAVALERFSGLGLSPVKES